MTVMYVSYFLLDEQTNLNETFHNIVKHCECQGLHDVYKSFKKNLIVVYICTFYSSVE